MTNHIPNDLSHLSDAEFNALCPQGEHAPGPQPLSPGAQAVLDAFNNRGLSSREWHDGKAASLKLAAALRAVSEHSEFVILDDSGYGDFVVKVDFLRAIAAELEGGAND